MLIDQGDTMDAIAANTAAGTAAEKGRVMTPAARLEVRSKGGFNSGYGICYAGVRMLQGEN